MVPLQKNEMVEFSEIFRSFEDKNFLNVRGLGINIFSIFLIEIAKQD